MELQMELTRRGVPFVVRSGLRFFEQAHIKDVTSYLRFVFNPFDEVSLRRILKLYPGIGKATAEKICLLVRRHHRAGADLRETLKNEQLIHSIPQRASISFHSFVKTIRNMLKGNIDPSRMIQIVMSTGYEDLLRSRYIDSEGRIDDIKQLVDFARQFSTLESFLSELSLLAGFRSETITPSGQEDQWLTLSSVHQAKGLEWRVVFVIWLCENQFPIARALQEGEGEEEERRLFYVAITRAMDELYLCYPIFHRSSSSGENIMLKPSRFISELPMPPNSPYEQWTIV
jgi:DNA helicase-2/ATP-dependent DNA helicase PcrA